MDSFTRFSGLAVGLLSLLGCADSAPTQQSKDYVSMFAGLDGAAPIVRDSTGAARDAAEVTRADTSVPVPADAGASASDAALHTPDDTLDAAAAGSTSSLNDAGPSDAGAGAPGVRDAAAPALPVDAGPPPPRAITIRFKAVVGSTDLRCGQTYPGVGSSGSGAYARDFRFFVQDLRLINAAGKDVPVQLANRPPFQAEGVSLIDFETGAGGCAGTVDVNTEITGSVPPDDYRGIAFTNGVPESLNHGDLSTAPLPLRAAGMRVSRLEGYRFMRAELVQSGASPDMTGSVELHVSGTECSGDAAAGSASCAKPNRIEVRLLGFDPGKNIIVADLNGLFAKVDLRAITVCHSELPLCDPLFDRLGIDYASGQPAGAQQLYRVGQ